MLVRIMKRAAELSRSGVELFASPALSFFLKSRINKSDFEKNPEVLDLFSQLDDFDVISAIKVWQNCDDAILSQLSTRLITRNLLKSRFSDEPFSNEEIQQKIHSFSTQLGLSTTETEYFVFTGKVENRAFKPKSEHIHILHKDGTVHHIEEDAAILNISVLSEPVVKHYICFPEEK